MSEEEEVQSQKKSSVEKGSCKDDTPMECEGDTENENIAKDNMEGSKRSSPRRKDPKDTDPVALEKIDLGKKGKTKGDNDNPEKAEDGGEGKAKPSKSGDEENVPEPPAKRRRLTELVQGNLSNEGNSPGRKNKPAKGKKVGKKAGKKTAPKKSRDQKNKAEEDISPIGGEYEVEKIVNVKIHKNGKKEFLIHWKGFSTDDNTWEPEANLTCKELVKKYFEEHKEELGDSGKGDKEKKSGKSKRRGASRVSRSKKPDPAADAESSAKGNAKKGKGNSKKSLGKGKKKQTRARKTGKDGVADSRKEGDGETKKTEKDEGEDTSQNQGNSREAKEKGERSGTPEYDDCKEYEVERIVDVRQPKEGKREFLIKWRGYSNKYNSWESENNMNCDEEIEKFLKSMEQNSTERGLRVVRKKTNRSAAGGKGRGKKTSIRLGKMPRKCYNEID